ncbi:hypothetical protein SCA03_60920 [Streptomyces cacaoi]|uniref:Uncharacterized protein n=1 Tax=Streptomyces cacaoi TaxID=1898 RepID=A0A4Y3R7E0_STRCI|nr:hypothetical protein SCA03_60920 [Streptomyces cacaoi]
MAGGTTLIVGRGNTGGTVGIAAFTQRSRKPAVRNPDVGTYSASFHQYGHKGTGIPPLDAAPPHGGKSVERGAREEHHAANSRYGRRYSDGGHAGHTPRSPGFPPLPAPARRPPRRGREPRSAQPRDAGAEEAQIDLFE